MKKEEKIAEADMSKMGCRCPMKSCHPAESCICTGCSTAVCPCDSCDCATCACDACANNPYKKSASGEHEMAEACGQVITLVEAIGDKQGREWDVELIKAGVSKTGTYYSPQILAEAVSLFEGARALCRSDQEHLIGTGDVRQIVGWYTNPCFENNAVKARFHISEAADWLRLLMKDAWENGKKDIVGFSILGKGNCKIGRMEGKTVRIAEAIEKIASVDVVFTPSAGGEILNLAAAVGQRQERELQEMDKLMQLLKEKRPDLHGKLGVNAGPEQIQAVFAEALGGQSSQSGGGNNLAEAQDILHQIKLQGCQTLINSKLAESGLPELSQKRLMKGWEGKLVEASVIDLGIAEEREYLANLSNSGKVKNCGRIAVGIDEPHKLVEALNGFFDNADVNKVPRFRSFREAYVTFTNDEGMTGKVGDAAKFNRLCEALGTSSWAEILNDSVTRRMLNEYRLPSLQDWRKLVSDITAPKDFRSNRRMRVGGYGELPAVAENGTYDTLTSPGDEEAAYSVSKKGGLEEISLEMIANDDIGAIRRIPIRLARAAANTLNRAVFNLIKNNVIIYDNVAVFHANHANLGSSALDASSLLTGKIAMGKQTAYGQELEVLGLVPKYMLVPLDLQDTAYKLTTSGTMIGAANNFSNEPNIHSSYNLEVIQVPSWTDTNDWALVCNPLDCPTIEVGFYNGQEEPELFVQDQPNVGSLFIADKITYKIRFIYGVCVLDYRGLYKSVVA